MKKIFFLTLLISSTIFIVFSQQRIIIRYVDPLLDTPYDTPGYIFSTWDFEKFEIRDPLWYAFIKQRVDSLDLCPDSIRCYFPNVNQQIIVIDGEKYDILSSDGSFAMEKNGKSVVFDKTLQININKAIKAHDPSYGVLEVPDPNGGKPIRYELDY